MCNLYSVTTNREAIRRLSQAMNDSIGNMPELPGIYPDYLAPIVRADASGRREVVLARWGLPSLKDEPTARNPIAGRPTCGTHGSQTGRATSASNAVASCCESAPNSDPRRRVGNALIH